MENRTATCNSNKDVKKIPHVVRLILPCLVEGYNFLPRTMELLSASMCREGYPEHTRRDKGITSWGDPLWTWRQGDPPWIFKGAWCQGDHLWIFRALGVRATPVNWLSTCGSSSKNLVSSGVGALLSRYSAISIQN